MKWPDEQQMLHIRKVEKSDRWLIARVLPEFEFCFMLQRLAASHTSWNKRRITCKSVYIRRHSFVCGEHVVDRNAGFAKAFASFDTFIQ